MTEFKDQLNKYLKKSKENNFGIDNFDELRFGSYTDEIGKSSLKTTSYLNNLKSKVWRLLYTHKDFSKPMHSLVESHGNGLKFLYDNLNTSGKSLLVNLIAYKILGFRHVKLSVNNSDYNQYLQKIKELKESDEVIDPGFMHFILNKFNLKSIGYNIILFFTDIGTITDFLLEQYAYKENGKTIIGADEGDIVFDIGGCWGDTALYFAEKTGDRGKVYSFEFIPNNIAIHDINTSLNPQLKNHITLVSNPVSDKSGETIYFVDNGPGSRISHNDFTGSSGSVQTVSIDDYVENNGVTKVDFIKMDIEGAEPLALQGAVNTIRKFKPKLAIAIYHSMDDLVNIPKWILDLDCGYEIFLGHYTIHSEETVIFARAF